ncbi:MAG: TetR family transcriptional regulator C-terminal domain-containing protein [Venatoribacter sp.]
MAKLSRIRTQNTENILAAAEQEFVLHGFKGTSMQSIADRAGLPKANIHYYFGNKEGLYRSLLEHILEKWMKLLDGLTEGEPKDILEHYIRSKVRLSFSEPNASKIFAMEIIQGAPFLKDYLEGPLLAWVKEKSDLINSWIWQKKMPEIDPVQLIITIWANTQHYVDFSVQVLAITTQTSYSEAQQKRIEDFVASSILKIIGF